MVEEVAGRADDQLQGAVRQDAGLDHDSHAVFSDIGRGAGRFDDGRHAGQQGGAKLLKHAPDREVEGVDVHGHALQRAEDVASHESAALGQRLQAAVQQKGVVGQLAAPLGGVGEQRARAALDVHPAVGAGGAGQGRESVELLLAGDDRLGQAFQHLGALVERHRAQGWPANSAGVCGHGREVDPLGAELGGRRAVQGAGDVDQAAGRGDPITADEVEKLEGFHRGTPEINGL